jgi:RNA 2',3'-cyclic 3'-phosphodiesterase
MPANRGSTPLRLFFAVLLPDDVLDAVQKTSDDLRAAIGDDGMRWARRDQYHFTLKFLGEVADQATHRVVEAALSAAEGQEPFRVSLGGAGAFPNDARPDTLWLGATGGVGPMTDLALRLETELARARFPRDKRPLKAHITLARVKGYAGETATAKALRTANIGDIAGFTVDHFALMRSTLRPSGSEYAVVEDFPFSIVD